MNIKILSKEKQPLFNREKVKFEIEHEGEPTPSKEKVRELLSNELKTELFVVSNINSKYGFGLSYGEARVYSKKEDMESLEPKYILKRNEKKQEGTASALKLLKGKIENDFIVINGDTFNDFDLRRMIQKHKQSGKVATIGLITSKKASKYGGILISGDEIIGIKDKDDSKDIFIINAGIYVFKPTIFKYISREKSLERDVFPKLVKEKQINGYFTHGFYIHAPEFGS